MDIANYPIVIGISELTSAGISIIVTAVFTRWWYRRKRRKEWYEDGYEMMRRAEENIKKAGLYKDDIDLEKVKLALDPIATDMIIHSEKNVGVKERDKAIIEGLGEIITGWVEAIDSSDDRSPEDQILHLQQVLREKQVDGDLPLDLDDLGLVLSLSLDQHNNKPQPKEDIFSSAEDMEEFANHFFDDLDQVYEQVNDSVDNNEDIPDEVNDLVKTIDEEDNFTKQDILNFPLDNYQEVVSASAGPINQKMVEKVLTNIIKKFRKSFGGKI